MTEERPESGIQQPAEATPVKTDESTAPETQEAIKLDPGKRYLVGKDEIPMLGTQMMNAMGRGQLASGLQSQLDVANAQVSEMDNVVAENTMLQQQLQDIDTNQRLEALVKERIPASPPPATTSDEWSTGYEPPAPTQADPAELARTIGDVTEQVTQERIGDAFGDVRGVIKEEVQNAMQEITQQQAVQSRQQQWARNQRETRMTEYVDNYGFTPSVAADLADMEAQAQLEERDARQFFAANRQEEAMNKYAAGQQLRHNVVTELAKQSRVHEDAQRTQLLQQQVESGTFTMPETQVEEKHKVIWNPAEAKAARKASLEKAHVRRTQELAAVAALGPNVRPIT